MFASDYKKFLSSMLWKWLITRHKCI